MVKEEQKKMAQKAFLAEKDVHFNPNGKSSMKHYQA